MRRGLFEIFEARSGDNRIGRLFDTVLVTLILLNVGAVLAETIEPIRLRFQIHFSWFEYFSMAVFTIEYVIRLWICVEEIGYREMAPWKARLRYASSPLALIDLAAIMPFYLAALALPDMRYLRIFRLLRVLKLVRYSPALATLGRVLYDERRALFAALIIMFGFLIFTASVMHYLEREAQPAAFGNIPQAMWWGVVTLTTVGYGDVVPITDLGKLFGGIVTILGLGLYALPIGIIASGFANEIHRREFVVTWNMVARVPLFATLDATSIAEISKLLRARLVKPGEIIVRRHDVADSMFFIVSGSVELDLHAGQKNVELSDGDFFGEMALLKETRRMATAHAVAKTQLLVLEASDFHHLLNRHTVLRKRILEISEARFAGGLRTEDGDLTAQELKHHES